MTPVIKMEMTLRPGPGRRERPEQRGRRARPVEVMARTGEALSAGAKARLPFPDFLIRDSGEALLDQGLSECGSAPGEWYVLLPRPDDFRELI